MNNYNPRTEYFNRKNKTQRSNDSRRENHKNANSIGGCSCNYIINTTTEQKVTKTRKEK